MMDNKDTKRTTEGHKFDGGKTRFDLVPIKPLFMLADLYTKGAEKYMDRNWEKGIKYGRLYSAALRHIFKWYGGEKYDPEDNQHHLTAAVWNLFALIELEETHPEMDDREPQNKRFTNSETDYDSEELSKEEQYVPLGPRDQGPPAAECSHHNWGSFGDKIVCQTCGMPGAPPKTVQYAPELLKTEGEG